MAFPVSRLVPTRPARCGGHRHRHAGDVYGDPVSGALDDEQIEYAVVDGCPAFALLAGSGIPALRAVGDLCQSVLQKAFAGELT
jgi:hypothetical protein